MIALKSLQTWKKGNGSHMVDANSIFDAYDGFISKLAKLKDEAEGLLAPTADRIRNEIAEYNRLAEIAGSASRLSLTEAGAGTDAGTDTAAETEPVVVSDAADSSASDEKPSTPADDAPVSADGTTEGDSHDNAADADAGTDTGKPSEVEEHADDAGMDEGVSSASAGGFYAEPARVEEVERTDGSTVKVERYRKPVRRETPVPEPMDVENIDFTGSKSDPNVIVSDPDPEEDRELEFADFLDDAVDTADTEKKDEKPAGKPAGRKTSSRRRATTGGKPSAKATKEPKPADKEAETDESDSYDFL